jgi:N-formylglutamate amidohydrolase
MSPGASIEATPTSTTGDYARAIVSYTEATELDPRYVYAYYNRGLNFPYYGGELVGRHADPGRGIESVFIEVNKKLFIDTRTFKKTPKFDRLKSTIDSMLVGVVAYARRKVEATRR